MTVKLPKMGNKVPHKLKPNHTTRLPVHIIALDTEAKQTQLDEKTFLQTLRLGWAVYKRLDRGTETWVQFKTKKEFFEWLENLLIPKKSYYIFAHNFDYDAQILGLYNWLSENPHVETRKFIVDSNVFIIKATYHFIADTNPENHPEMSKLEFKKYVKAKYGKPPKAYLIFLSTTNFTHYPLKKIGKILGIEKMDVDVFTEDEDLLSKYCRRDTEIVLRFVEYLIKFIKEHDLGSFQETIAKQAFTAFRHRFMKHEIFIHADPEATALERLSYRGGRNEAFFIGTLEDEEGIYDLDVNSMYPYVMKNHIYPVKLLKVMHNVSPNLLTEIMKAYLVIADVCIEINEPAVGVREDKLIFPVGKFRVVLTSPELELVLKYGKILKIHSLALYEGAPIFKEYVDYFYTLRLKYKAEGNEVMQFFCKIMLNSLYGKFGQKNEEFITIGYTEKPGNVIYRYYDADKGKWEYFAVIDHKIMKKEGYVESFNGFVAIASFVTAYARCRLWEFIEKAGKENVLYCDTDSLFVTKKGYDNLKEFIDTKKLGFLKIEKSGTRITIHGAKDYEFAGEVKMKGVKKTARKVGENEFEQIQFVKTRGNLLKHRTQGVILKIVRKKLKRQYDKGIVEKSGWVRPFVLNEC